MPRNELRISGALQAAVIALVLGGQLRHVAASAPSAWWPYLVGGYGALAATLPWFIGGIGRDEFSPRLSLLLGLLFALPLTVAAYWLRTTPYRPISLGCLALVAAWGLHLLVATIAAFTRAEK